MEKLFAKPFIGNLSGHTDGISCLCKSPIVLTNYISGSFDGEIRFWDLSTRKTVFSIDAHPKIVKGLAYSSNGHHFLSCGGDSKINMYSVQNCLNTKENEETNPINIYLSRTFLQDISHSPNERKFATTGQIIQIWSYERSIPLMKFEWN